MRFSIIIKTVIMLIIIFIVGGLTVSPKAGSNFSFIEVIGTALTLITFTIVTWIIEDHYKQKKHKGPLNNEV